MTMQVILFDLNPVHQKISIYILLTHLHTFTLVAMWRICLIIKVIWFGIIFFIVIIVMKIYSLEKLHNDHP